MSISAKEETLCRSIKVLRKQGQPASADELNAAALQFVRKISGYHHPSHANQEAFDLAIHEVAAASKRLLDSLVTPSRTPPSKAGRADLGGQARRSLTASRSKVLAEKHDGEVAESSGMLGPDD